MSDKKEQFFGKLNRSSSAPSSQLQISIVLHHTEGVPGKINRGNVCAVHCTLQVPDVLNQKHTPFEKNYV